MNTGLNNATRWLDLGGALHTGFVVTTLSFKVTGNSIEGEATYVTDTGFMVSAHVLGSITRCP